MSRPAIPTWFFSLVVVRLGHRFLMVRENKQGYLWYLPAGRVEPGESLIEAARREALEEAGIPIVIEGIVRIEHTPAQEGSRVRVIFVARPMDDSLPKKYADEHSLEAAWVTLEDLEYLPLRGEEVKQLFYYISNGAPIYPLELLAYEGQSLPSR
ncbi:MAG: NUDIX hydrolase [Deltaproteobacteria bacterium]|nr:NUDIX hydrolase [Deltaproteobacteria bacterium]MBU48354.1 NUDIX hydrolase [Deltaproteobacteria bacterium]|tara:strand:- start:32923 stop:33387 length:465 start_codon:yes stop_codon:yes gene_type:complete